jgi:putative flippase GtrA
MPVTSSPMSTSRFAALRELVSDPWKLVRYCGVSVINVLVGSGTFVLCLNAFDMEPLPANLVAWAVSTGPAYILSRYWVWEQTGENSVKAEIAPFWILALIGLGFSSVCVTIAGTMTDHSLVLLAVQFCAYGVVWVAKFVILDRLMWGPDKSADVEVEVV